MRVTAVTTTVPGPRKPRLLSFIRALRLAGHDVSVVATSDFSQAGGSAVDDEGWPCSGSSACLSRGCPTR